MWEIFLFKIGWLILLNLKILESLYIFSTKWLSHKDLRHHNFEFRLILQD